MQGESWKKIGSTRYTNDKQITDHYAIIPTGQGLNNLRNLSELSAKVYETIVRRFLGIFYPPAVYQKVALVTEIGGEQFFSNFRVLVQEGYLKAMQRHQLSVNEIDNLISPIGIDQYKETISAYLDRIIKRSDAIVCANDYIASLVLQYCQKNKISVPNDLYVSGFDDNQEFNNSIALTSVHVNNDRIGVHLANRLVHRLTHPDDDYEYTYIRSRTVYRESTND